MSEQRLPIQGAKFGPLEKHEENARSVHRAAELMKGLRTPIGRLLASTSLLDWVCAFPAHPSAFGAGQGVKVHVARRKLGAR
jgi:hypothetical protein